MIRFRFTCVATANVERNSFRYPSRLRFLATAAIRAQMTLAILYFSACTLGLLLSVAGAAEQWATPVEEGSTADEPGDSAVAVGQRQVPLAEDGRLVGDVVNHFAEGRWAQAIAAIERFVIEQQGDELGHEDILRLLHLLADLHAYDGRLERARQIADQALKLAKEHLGAGHWKTADAERSLAYVDKLSSLPFGQRQQLGDAARDSQKVRVLYEQRKYAEALPLAQRALESRRRILGGSHPQVRDALVWLGELYERTGELEKAVDLYRQAFAIAREVLGADHPDTADSAYDLGRLLASQDDVAEAETLLLQSLEIRERIRGTDPLEVAPCCWFLGLVYGKRDEREKAEANYLRAIAICERAPGGKTHWVYSLALYDLGILYDAMQRLDDAERFYRRSLEAQDDLAVWHDLQGLLQDRAEASQARGDFAGARRDWEEAASILTKLHGPGDYRATDARLAARHAEHLASLSDEDRKRLDAAGALDREADRHDGQGDYRTAIRVAAQSLEISRKVLGDEHPDTATRLNNLGCLYSSMADYAKAEPLYRQSLEIYRKVLGDEHPDTATSLNNLGYLYSTMADYAKAESLYRQSLEIRMKVLDEEHPDTAVSLSNLGHLYSAMADYAQAEPLYRQSLEIFSKVLGEEHPETALSLNHLGVLYGAMGDCAKAEPLVRRSLEITRKVLGEEHPDTAASLSNLGYLYSAMGDYAKAEPMYRQSLEIWTKLLGEEHPNTAMSRGNLGALYFVMGDYAKAERLCRQSLDIRRKVLGEEHPDTALSLNNLGGLYSAMGEDAKAEPLYRQSLEIRRKVLGKEHPDTASA
jgi:tetratricopeptide (TPR) repeat protein